MDMEELRARLPIAGTRASILAYLLEEDQSAIDLEDKLDINESAIRRHLDTLEQRGYVGHYFEKAPRGRPKKLYTITSAGRKLFPQKIHLLFKLLIREVEEKYGEEHLEELLSKVSEKFAGRLGPSGSSKDMEDKIKKFVNSLDKFGFYPSFSKEDGNYLLRYRNCVFGEVENKLRSRLCDMHTKIVENVFPECEVYQKKSVGKGDNMCVHILRTERFNS